MGNIYADEALFRARVHPLRPAGRLTRKQVAAVRDGVVASLEAGLAAKGASIDDFRHPDGVQGSFQDRFLIHLREGEPCLVCGRAVRKLRAAGRGTYVCERCQPRPRALRRRRGTRPGGPSGRPRRAPESPRSASPSRSTCGKVIMPVSATSSARPSASLARLISSYGMPRASSSAFAVRQ